MKNDKTNTNIKLWPIQRELIEMNEAQMANKVMVKVTTEDKELKDKAKTFERILQYIVDDHIKVFGLHDDMLKPGITKLGFNNEFGLEVTKVPYEDVFIVEDEFEEIEFLGRKILFKPALPATRFDFEKVFGRGFPTNIKST